MIGEWAPVASEPAGGRMRRRDMRQTFTCFYLIANGQVPASGFLGAIQGLRHRVTPSRQAGGRRAAGCSRLPEIVRFSSRFLAAARSGKVP